MGSVLGFRRCQRPHCLVSRTRTVWPSEWRVAVPVWGLVHLACRPTPRQYVMLRHMEARRRAMRRLVVAFQVNTEPMRQALAKTTAAMDRLAAVMPEPELWEPQPGVQRARWDD